MKKYDVVIVGAGPGGVMAAKTAAENGLRTAILERKTNPAKITRGCAMMFAIESDYYFAERMYYNEKNQKMIFPVNGFTVDYKGPTRNFYAWHFYAPDGKTRLAFGDYEESIKKGDKGRLSFVYDKGKLIEGLMNDAVKNGVDVFTGVNVEGVEKTTKGVKVIGNGDSYAGTFVIAADGLNSQIAQQMGFNQGRKFYSSHPSQTYYVKGLNIPQSEAAITAIYYKPHAPFPNICFIVPSPYTEDEYWMGVQSKDNFKYITQKSVFSEWFSNVKITRILGYVFSLRAPVAEPYKENVLLVGDSAWYGEAEITGSMMCGWKAANAITVALRDHQPDRDGVLPYIEWWKKSYPEFDDYRNFMMFAPFCFIFSEKELIYLYNRFSAPLRATLNPFLVVRIVKKALESELSQIQKEMPSVLEKLKMLEVDNVEKLSLRRRGQDKKVDRD